MHNDYVFVVKDFITPSECRELSNWIAENVDTANFGAVEMGGKRLSTRFKVGFKYPELAHDIKKRIIEKFNFETIGIKYPHFMDAMVASCAFPSDTCYAHKDPVWHENHFTLHCNILISEPEGGGNLLIEGTKYKMNAGDLVCYPVSKFLHETDEVIGSKVRLLWIFGFCLKEGSYGITEEDFTNGNWQNKFGKL